MNALDRRGHRRRDRRSADFRRPHQGRRARGRQRRHLNPVKAGWYVASIIVLSSAKSIKTTAAAETVFGIKETAGYADVPADAWSADSVCKAADNDYMADAAAGIFAPGRP